MCPAWTGHYTKEPPDTICCHGAQNIPRETASPHLTQGWVVWDSSCTRRKPWISMNKSAGRGSWDCGRLSSICLNQREKRRWPRGPNRVSQDPKVGVIVAITETTSPPPSLLTCQSAWKQIEWPVELTVKIFNFSGSREPLHIFRVRLVDVNHT